VNRNPNSGAENGIPELPAAIIEAINRLIGRGSAITGDGNRVPTAGSPISSAGNGITESADTIS
jgi:hypothetical protein